MPRAIASQSRPRFDRVLLLSALTLWGSPSSPRPSRTAVTTPPSALGHRVLTWTGCRVHAHGPVGRGDDGEPQERQALSRSTLSNRGRDCDAIARGIGGAPIQVWSRWSPEVQHYLYTAWCTALYYPQPVPPQGSPEARR